MFTLQQINTAHSKVKSGIDFPAYIREIKTLGVRRYETHVRDGRTDYFGADDFKAGSPPRYEAIEIAAGPDSALFRDELLAHQQGKTDFPAFCKACARTGVEKWTVDLENMTCTYFDVSGHEMLRERIPA